MAPSHGYWGDRTSTMDWCEDNYAVSHYVAEFWNTISNAILIIPPIHGMYCSYAEKLESRIFLCHMSLLVVGIGSWAFHMTLHYRMQLLDEFPMILGSCVFVYACAMLSSPPKSENRRLKFSMAVYCAIVFAMYLLNRSYIIFEIAYGVMVMATVIISVSVVVKYDHSTSLLISAVVLYGTGFVLWNIDNHFCHHLKYLRGEVLGGIGPVSQLHAWWHLLAGCGTYMSLLFVTHARYVVLKRNPQLKLLGRFFPYVTLQTESTSKPSDLNGNLSPVNSNFQ